MTNQTQLFIELSDILSLRCECRNPECRAVLVLPLTGTLNGALRKCPKCKGAWAGYEHTESNEPDIQRFIDSLRHVSSLKLGCNVTLEIKLGAPPVVGRS
jgi:hypothetical protein